MGVGAVFQRPVLPPVRPFWVADFCHPQCPGPDDFWGADPADCQTGGQRSGCAGCLFRQLVASLSPCLLPLSDSGRHPDHLCVGAIRVAAPRVGAVGSLSSAHHPGDSGGRHAFRGGVRHPADQIQPRGPGSDRTGRGSFDPCPTPLDRQRPTDDDGCESLHGSEFLGLRHPDLRGTYPGALAGSAAVATGHPDPAGGKITAVELPLRRLPLFSSAAGARKFGALGVRATGRRADAAGNRRFGVRPGRGDPLFLGRGLPASLGLRGLCGGIVHHDPDHAGQRLHRPALAFEQVGWGGAAVPVEPSAGGLVGLPRARLRLCGSFHPGRGLFAAGTGIFHDLLRHVFRGVCGPGVGARFPYRAGQRLAPGEDVLRGQRGGGDFCLRLFPFQPVGHDPGFRSAGGLRGLDVAQARFRPRVRRGCRGTGRNRGQAPRGTGDARGGWGESGIRAGGALFRGGSRGDPRPVRPF